MDMLDASPRTLIIQLLNFGKVIDAKGLFPINVFDNS